MAPKCSIDSPWNKILHIFDISAQTGSKNLKKGLTGIGDRKLHLNSFSAIFDTSCYTEPAGIQPAGNVEGSVTVK